MIALPYIHFPIVSNHGLIGFVESFLPLEEEEEEAYIRLGI
jgi:hypothetical protein